MNELCIFITVTWLIWITLFNNHRKQVEQYKLEPQMSWMYKCESKKTSLNNKISLKSAGLGTEYFQAKRVAWPALCRMTHGGLMLVDRIPVPWTGILSTICAYVQTTVQSIGPSLSLWSGAGRKLDEGTRSKDLMNSLITDLLLLFLNKAVKNLHSVCGFTFTIK